MRARSQRARLGLFVCEGEDLVAAALDAGLEPVDALVDAARPVLVDRLEVEAVEPKLLAGLAELGHPPRVLAVFRAADLPRLDPRASPPVAIALWRVSDPANVGAILRTADALGPAAVYLSPGCADPTGPKAVRASMGALFRVPTGRFDAVPGLRVALVPLEGRPLGGLDLGERVTFVLGAEREGLSHEVLATCDETATIPIENGAESLNVAAVAAIALYELRRRRSST